METVKQSEPQQEATNSYDWEGQEQERQQEEERIRPSNEAREGETNRESYNRGYSEGYKEGYRDGYDGSGG